MSISEDYLSILNNFKSVHGASMIEIANKMRENRVYLQNAIDSSAIQAFQTILKHKKQIMKTYADAKSAFRYMNATTLFESAAIMLAEENRKKWSTISSILNSSAFRLANEMASKFNYIGPILNNPLINMTITGEIPATSFAGTVYSTIDDLDDDTAIDGMLSNVEDTINKQCKKLRPGIISYEGMIQFLMALIFFIYNVIDAEILETKIDNIRETQQSILLSIESLLPQEKTEETIYFVNRTVKLRAKPTTKSTVIRILYPNQIVTLLDTKGKWIYVQYFDYIEGLPRTGWVSKKYTKRIN